MGSSRLGPNPFAGFGNVVGGDRFVGRVRLRSIIVNRLDAHVGSLAVIGTRRIGKTSLVLDAVRQAVELVNSIKLDLSAIPDSQELFLSLGEAIRDYSIDAGLPQPLVAVREPSATSAYTAYRDTRRALIRAKESGINTRLILDEFDAVRSFPDATVAIQRLRELVYHIHETGLLAVFISRRSLRAIELSIADVSTLDGVCEQHYLGPFGRDEYLELLQRAARAGWILSDEDAEIIWFYAGGHPFLSEMILCRSWDQQDCAEGIRASLASIFDHYENLRDALTPEGLFDQIVQLAVGPRISVTPGSLERALRFGLIRPDDVSQKGSYRGWSDHFQLYLEKCAREIPIVTFWRETELAMRRMVQDIMVTQHGPAWVDVLGQAHPKLKETLAMWNTRMAKEAAHFDKQYGLHPIDYSYPMEIWSVVGSQWRFFSKRLGHSPSYWNQRFSHLAKIRTPAAHGREAVIPIADLRIAEIYCKELLETMAKSGG